MQVTIRNAYLTVTASAQGAELQSVRCDGRERLWQNENGSWAGHAPILYPVCGATAVRLGGRVYPCPFHGIARAARFTVAAQTERSVCFRLLSDDETKKVYPFSFRFDVIYTLRGRTLTVTYEIENTGTEVLYASCGGHDSFALGDTVGAYALCFEKAENLDDYLTDGDGHLTGETVPLGEGRVLDLATPLLDGGGSICLDHLRSRAVTLRHKTTGEQVARLAFPDTEKLVLWHPEGSRMLCIEPWQTLPDTAGETRDLSEKDGILTVPPQQTLQITRRILYGYEGAEARPRTL